MKMMLVSNDDFAVFTKNSLLRCSMAEGVDRVCFTDPDYKAGTRELAAKLFDALTENTDERFLIVADRFGSTAYNEAALLLARAGLTERAHLVTADAMMPMPIEEAEAPAYAA